MSRLATQLANAVDPALASDDEFTFGCLLHDVGKIGVPERILMKPGPLTADEWEVMRRHPQTGARVVRPLGLGQMVGDVVLYHHERWDGRGYPDKLAGEDIPRLARIVAIADTFDAMTSDRPYRKGLPAEAAFDEVRKQAGKQFDPQLAEAFQEIRDGILEVMHARRANTVPVAAEPPEPRVYAATVRNIKVPT